MGTIDQKTTIPLFAVIATIPFAIAFAVWITSVAADAKKGAKAADKITVIYYDVKAIKKELRIKDEPKNNGDIYEETL